MIFVTVGTHEQPFDRLLEAVDVLKENGDITDQVIMQTGFSTYEPICCQWERLYPYAQMQKLIAESRIVITHGGPSSFIAPLQFGKIPVVVPRQKKFGEHVNDHQIDFCRAVVSRQKNIIEVECVGQLGEIIRNYDQIVAGMELIQNSNNKKFCEEFAELVKQMFDCEEEE